MTTEWRFSFRIASVRLALAVTRSLHRDPLIFNDVICAVNDINVAARGPRNHLAVQRQMVDFFIVRDERLFDERFAFFGIGLFA